MINMMAINPKNAIPMISLDAGILIVYLIFKFGNMQNAFCYLKTADTVNPEMLKTLFSTYIEKGRYEGILSLEKDIPECGDAFTASGLEMIIDGTDAEIMELVLNNLINSFIMKSRSALWNIFALGVSVILISLFASLVGFLFSTLKYVTIPIIFAFGAQALIFIPWFATARRKIQKEITLLMIRKSGLISIQEGHDPKLCRQLQDAYDG